MKQNYDKFIARHKRDLRMLKAKPSIGCNHGFRKAAANSTAEELASLRAGEDHTLYRALIHNGAHPDYRNGTTLLPKYQRLLAKARRSA